MKISCIVPVYNAEKYLKACLDSILNQTHSDLEIIVVDDGSTDHSGQICDEYMVQDPRVKVIHQRNQGQSVARNVGIHHSESEYVTFVDSDDELVFDAIENLVKPLCMKKWDVIAGSFLCFRKNQFQQVNYPISNTKLERNSLAWNQIKTESIFGYCWGKLYKKSILPEFDDIRTMIMEDNLLNLKIWQKNPDYYVIDKPVYKYYIRMGSSSNTTIPNMEQKALHTILTYISYLKEQKSVLSQLDVLIPLIARIFCWTMIHPIPENSKKYKCVYHRIHTFMDAAEIQEILHTYSIWSPCKKLTSVAQRIFYSFCLVCLKNHQTWFLLVIFIGLHPALKWYAYRECNK